MEIIGGLLIGYLAIGILLATPSGSLKEFLTIVLIYPVILAYIFMDLIEVLLEDMKRDAEK